MQSRLGKVLGFAFAALVLSCTTVSQSPKPRIESSATSLGLSEGEARVRAQQVNDVTYELKLDVSDANVFRGSTLISFRLIQASRDLRVDLTDAKVESVILNGQAIAIDQSARALWLRAGTMKTGRNVLQVTYNAPYSREGRGLHRFVDPEDNRVYLWTQFQPFDANRVFPCFDQPDIKATYRLHLTTPKGWEAVSSTRETDVRPTSDGRLEWEFPESARFSTYLFSLHAGQYQKWEDRKFRYPLRLFARHSLAKFVKAEEWFEPTRRGLEFFDDYFGIPYAYRKYDHVVIPEAQFGAMENVAAVTFNEWFISRGAKSPQRQRGHQNVIWHEMAHMWFGNLVTMKWWGDLWLNETFATYMASRAAATIDSAPELIWQDFFGSKSWAYYFDQMPTTHPLVADVPDTDSALANFDAITYGKGAAVIKQLSFVLGEGPFRAGLRSYFQKFQGGNTTALDFVTTLGQAAGRDLSTWRKAWFESAGLNEIATKLECQEGRISQLLLIQSAPSGESRLRPHRFQLAILQTQDIQRAPTKIINVDLEGGQIQLAEAVGLPCPAAVIPNWDDHGYFKVRLDSRTVNTLTSSINEFSDPLLRQMLWSALWERMRDGEMTPWALADLIVPAALAKESNEGILRQLTHFLTSEGATGIMTALWLAEPDGRGWREFVNKLDEVAWLRLKSAPAGSDAQLIWFDLFSRTAASPGGLANAKRLLSGSDLKGLKLDADRRWQLIARLAAMGDKSAPALLQQQTQIDRSARGVEQRLRIQAMLASWEQKLGWIEEYKKDKSEYSLAQLDSALEGLFPLSQEDLRNRFAANFYAELPNILKNKSDYAAAAFLATKPRFCSSESAAQLRSFMDKQVGLPKLISKSLQEGLAEGERCQKILARATSGNRFGQP